MRVRLHPLPWLLVVACLPACGAVGGEDHVQAELVPATERIVPNDNGPWFTISPDERLLAFMSADSTSGSGFATIHLVTIDLTTSQATHHDLREIPDETFPSDWSEPWYQVQKCLEERAWLLDSLYICVWLARPNNSPWISFTPGVAAGRLADNPKTRSCLDCSPPDEWRRVIQSFGLSTDGRVMPQVAYRDGIFADNVYRARMGDGGAAIERLSRDGTAELLFEKRETLRDTYIGELRVSPDGRFLAYTLLSNLKSPVPLPTWRCEVYVRDMVLGVESRVSPNCWLCGNLMWSANSGALYYAVVDGKIGDGVSDGVFRATVPIIRRE